MNVIRDECVGCPPEMGCLGRGCPYANVEVTVCDKCGDDASYKLDGEDYCENCATEYVEHIYDTLSFKEKCELLDIELEELE